MSKILFICNFNKNRSRTAEEIFKNVYETKSAGILNNPVTQQDIDWADLIVVMEDFQKDYILKKFPLSFRKKQIISLKIEDFYLYMEAELIELLNSKRELIEKSLIYD